MPASQIHTIEPHAAAPVPPSVHPVLLEHVGRDPHADETECSHAPGMCGPQAIAHAVKDALRTGKVQKLLVRQHPTRGDATYALIAFGVGKGKYKKCLRWCGENDDPNGAGSSSVIASWYDDERLDPAALAGAIGYMIGSLCRLHDAWVYRQD